MHELYELKEKLLKELSEYAQNGKYSKEDVETIKYMASAVDHICNIVSDMEEEYSMRGNQGGNGGMYSREGGGGYSRNYSRYDGGSYARGRGRNARRDSMGRYSRAGNGEGMVEQLEQLMEEAPNEQIRQQMRQLVQQIEQM